MKVLNAKVEWMDEFDNPPDIKILVDKMPSYKDHIYEQKGNMYWAENQGLVSFYYYERPDEGFGGRKFNLIMKDGSLKTLIGPWSSSCSQMNNFFPASKEVAITDDPAVWERGHTFYASAILLDLWKGAIDEFCHDAHYVVTNRPKPYSAELSGEQNIFSDGPTQESYEIARKGMGFEQSQMFKKAKRAAKYIKELSDPNYKSYFGDRLKSLSDQIDYYNELVIKYTLYEHGLEVC